MGSAPRFPISALTLVEKHIPYTVYSIPNFPQKQNPIYVKPRPTNLDFIYPIFCVFCVLATFV